MTPRVEKIDEFKNGSTDVDPALKTITIRFTRPMNTKGYSIYVGPKGMEHFPPVKGNHYKDSKTFILEVGPLKPGHDYQFVVKGDNANFYSETGVPLEDYEVNFTTSPGNAKGN